MTTFLDNLLVHLADAGLARLPSVAGDAPPFWRNPSDGVPGPGDKTGVEADDGLVLAGFAGGRIAPGHGEGYARRRVIEIRLRSFRFPAIEEAGDALEDELAPAPYGVRFNWTMGELGIIESRIWNGLAPIDASEGQGYHYRISFLFETLR